MHHQQPHSTAASFLEELEPAEPFHTFRSRRAYDELMNAFTEGLPMAIVNSGWSYGSNQLLKSFLDEVGDNVFLVRITEACENDIDCMRELVRPIGVNPDKLDVADLEKVLVRFLAFQEKRHRRTVVILEETKDNREWMRERARHLIDLESREHFGMLVILARRSRFNELPDFPLLDNLSVDVGEFISLTPFTSGDTRKFIRWRIDADDSADISRIFDFQAITLIHELAEGMPDAIDALCCASLELADNEDTAPVTTSIVMRVSEDLGIQQSGVRTHVAPAEPLAAIPTLKVHDVPRIVIRYQGRKVRELKVEKPRISIGRGVDNDVCINSPFVSRQHAAIIRDGQETAIVDLDSQNGTFVNSERIRAKTMSDQDEIKIGHHRIKFTDPQATPKVSLNGVVRNRPIRTSYLKPGSGVLTSSRLSVGALEARKPPETE
ncbi:MAG: FHA domain-containing protein [Woeseiaceae bacterium]